MMILRTLVLQIKTSKIINDSTKVRIKSDKITSFGGFFIEILYLTFCKTRYQQGTGAALYFVLQSV